MGRYRKKENIFKEKKKEYGKHYRSSGKIVNRITYKEDDSKYGEEYNYDNEGSLELKVTWNALNDKFIYEHYKDGKVINKIIQ